MKVRTGFISNSSSSSFIVKNWTEKEVKADLTRLAEKNRTRVSTEMENLVIELLEEYGSEYFTTEERFDG